MDNLATDMATRFRWTEASILPDYASLFVAGCGIGCLDGGPLGVYPQLYSAHSDGHYVGLGWSMGGLIARYEAQNRPGFLDGLVTTHSPNQGVYLAEFGHRALFLYNWVRDEARMLRPDISLLYYGASPLLVAAEFAGQILDYMGSLEFGGVASDISPSSSFLNGVNGPQPTNVKRVAIFGSTNWPYYPAYASEYTQATWLGARSHARDRAADFDHTAEAKLSDIHRHWYNFVEWPEVWYNRSRAGDWSDAANAMEDEEASWEVATIGNGVSNKNGKSDGLISTSSQSFIPNYTNLVQDNLTCGCQVNHGGAVFNTNSAVRDQIQVALQDAGAQ